MRRVWLAVTLLVLIAAVSAGGLLTVCRSVKTLEQQVQIVRVQLTTQNRPALVRETEALLTLWEETEPVCVRLVRRADVHEAEEHLAKLPALLEQEYFGAFSAELDCAGRIIHRLWEDEVPIGRNIF